MDPIPNETAAEVMQFDLNGEGGSWICDGEEPFPPNREGVVRFAVAPWDLPPDTEHLRHDSDQKTLMPSVDVDGEDAIELMLGFYTGSRPVVAVRAKTPIPREEFPLRGRGRGQEAESDRRLEERIREPCERVEAARALGPGTAN